MSYSIKDHPFYPRMRQLSCGKLVEIHGLELPENLSKAERLKLFKKLVGEIRARHKERTSFGFKSDLNAELARAMEWAFQGGEMSEDDD